MPSAQAVSPRIYLKYHYSAVSWIWNAAYAWQLKPQEKAGMIVLAGYRSGDVAVRYKRDGSPQTDVDVAAEWRIRSILRKAFPYDGFCGEEDGSVDGTNGCRWDCDPCDGTRAALNGERTAAVSLALSEDDRTVLAVVYNPFERALFSGADGIPATLNGEPLPRYTRRDPRRAVYNYQISPHRKLDVIDLCNLWERRDIAKLVSTGGSIAYNLAQVAEGVHGVFIGRSLEPADAWDIRAGIYFVRSVGGEVEHFDGNRIIVASNTPEIHKQTIYLLAKLDSENHA